MSSKSWVALCFTVVGAIWSLVFSRCLGRWETLYFAAATPYGELGTSMFKFSLKVAGRISARVYFTMFFAHLL